VLRERDPVMLRVANSWLILNGVGGLTDDKPDVTLVTPQGPSSTNAFLNVRVADIPALHRDWSAKGVEFLTEPKDHGQEIRAYVRAGSARRCARRVGGSATAAPAWRG